MKLSINVYISFRLRRDEKIALKQQWTLLSLSFSLSASCESQLARAALNHPFLITISNGPRLTRINYLRWQYSASGANRGAATNRSLERRAEKFTSSYIHHPSINIHNYMYVSANLVVATLATKEAWINPRRIKSIAMLVANRNTQSENRGRYLKSILNEYNKIQDTTDSTLAIRIIDCNNDKTITW